MSARHLTKRFFGSLGSTRLTDSDQVWARSHLIPSEQLLWSKMSNTDQRHACAVVRDVLDQLGSDATRPVLAAALLHDVGKVRVNAGTWFRVLATLLGKLLRTETTKSWTDSSGLRGRVGSYLNHHEIGAAMLQEAGSDPITVAWAREHELPRENWTLPDHLTKALWQADNH